MAAPIKSKYALTRKTRRAPTLRGRIERPSRWVRRIGLDDQVLKDLRRYRPWLGIFTLNRLCVGVLVLLALYLWGLSADRYVSEASFTVRSGAVAAGDEDDIFSIAGGQTAADDTFAIHDFILSRDMMRKLERRVNLREIYGKGGWDVIFSYPSLLNGSSQEELFRHYKMLVSIIYKTSTGVSTLRVEAFDPKDAQLIAALILEESELFVNELNARARSDAVDDARVHLAAAREELVATQTEMAVFRSRELMLDPSKSSYLVVELVGRLSEELAKVNAQISSLRQAVGNSPQLPVLRRRAVALQQQIIQERQRTTARSDGLASKIATFERLSVEHELAVKNVAAAFKRLVLAQTQANRQQLYLQRITRPHLPDYATQPRRLGIFLAGVVLLLIAAMVVWMLLSGLREHKAAEPG